MSMAKDVKSEKDSHPPPHNYDFIANWSTILPHLYGEEVDLLLCAVYDDVNRRGHEVGKYTGRHSPAQQLSWGDGYDTLVFDRVDEIIENRDRKYLSSSEIRFLDRIAMEWNAEILTDAAYDGSKDQKRELAIRNRISMQLYDFARKRDQIAFWVPFGRCHSWNAIWGLWLAKKMVPHGGWTVRVGPNHTTVYSAKLHMVFDILAYFWDGQLQQHEMGDKIDWSADPSRGGASAWTSSDPKAKPKSIS
jgi:hypothetical protein